MKYPDIWTVWVVREQPCLVGTASTEQEATTLGNSRVSTKDFVIRKFTDTEWKPSMQDDQPEEEHPSIDLSRLPTGGVDLLE
jgi:hypothetical protein